jgi:two-component system OmpR family sensor kinase
MKQPIRFRRLLTILYLGTVIPLLIVVGILLDNEYRVIVLDASTTQLRNLVDAVVARRGPPGPPTLANDAPALARSLDNQLQNTEVTAAVLDERGQLIRQAGERELLLDQDVHDDARESGVARVLEVRHNATNYLVYLLPVQAPNGRVRSTIEARLPLTSVETSLATMRVWLMTTIGGAALLALAIAPFVGRVAVRPLKQLRATAQGIARGDFDRRAEPSTVIEFNELATTFNAMLDRLQEALQKEERAATEMRRFAADASHELRSPLAVFGNSVDVLERALRNQDGERAAEVIGLMRGEIGAMTRLVDDLLLLARMQQPGQAPIRRETVEPLPLLEEVYERGQLLARGQALRLEWPQTPIQPIDADRDALKRALNNLVENAIRHTPLGHAIVLSTQHVETGCRFTVRDEGSGIPPEHLPHIFERFYRGDSARDRAITGSGLGLAIVRAIVDAHGGQIYIKSAPGEGTTVALIIPSDVQPGFSGDTASIQEGVVSFKVKEM